jgi:hypothetical protein
VKIFLRITGIVILLVGFLIFLWSKTALVQFSVQNNIPGYNFAVSGLLANLFIYRQGYHTDIKKVKVIFTTEEQQDVRLLLEEGSGSTASLGVTKEGNSFTFWEQYSQKALTTALGNTEIVKGYKINFDEDQYAYLCLVMDPARPGRDECYQKAKDYMVKLGNFPLLKMVRNVWKLGFKLVGDVMAQCAGTIPCGGTMSGMRCSNNHLPCPCSGGGTCQLETWCDVTLNNLNCSDLGNQSLCISAASCASCYIKCNINCTTPPYCGWGGGGPPPGGCQYFHHCSDQCGVPCGGAGTCAPLQRCQWMESDHTCDPNYTNYSCTSNTEECPACPTPTPLPPLPPCVSFSTVYIDSCTPLSNYSPVIQPVCMTTNSSATLHLAYPNNATTVQYLTNVNPAAACDSSLNWGSAPTINTGSTSISLNVGLNKACVRYVNAGGDAICGGIIQRITPSCTGAGPSGNPTIPFSQTSYTVSAYGVANASKVTFYVWSDANGQTDMQTIPGTNMGGGTWQATINMAPFWETGQFQVDIWLDNFAVYCGSAKFIRAPTPTITGAPTPTITGAPTPTHTGTPTPTITGAPTPTPTCTPYCSGSCFYGCSSTSCGGGTCFCPTTAPINLSPSLTCTDTVFRTYTWSSVAGATGYQFQLYRGGLWCKNISVASTSYTLSSCDNPGLDTTTGPVTWGVAAHYTHNSCADSAFTTTSYALDKTAPTVPTGLTATCDMLGVVRASWAASTDTGCSGVDSYWAQVSTDPAFATAYSDSSWTNGWASGVTRSTNAGAFSGGTTVYVHVRSRDAVDNQSAFSSPPISVVCPIQTGTIKARAVSVDPSDTSCATIRSGGTGSIGGTVFQFTPSSASQPAPQTQSGSSYVVFNNAAIGTYIIAPQAPAGYTSPTYCWSRSTAPTSGTANTADLYAGDTLTWDIGYVHGVAWSQAGGGDVYASGMLQSYVPVGAVPAREFIPAGAGGYPGLATYGTDYNFDSSGATKGETWVSSKNWLANDTAPAATDYYQLMYSQYGGDPATWDYDHPASAITKPASRATPYYVKGDMTTSGDWSVWAGQTIVFIVDGNVTIAGKITITGNGFVSFIVNGNITVDPSVGALQGIYITSPAGTFATGTGAVRLIGTGTFVAGNFNLQRDLGDTGNPTTSSELFIYNPQLLFSMPDQMKKLPVSWQEVAP